MKRKRHPATRVRSQVITIRLDERTNNLLAYAAALELRTKSSHVEWLIVQHIEQNYGRIVKFSKLQSKEQP